MTERAILYGIPVHVVNGPIEFGVVGIIDKDKPTERYEGAVYQNGRWRFTTVYPQDLMFKEKET